MPSPAFDSLPGSIQGGEASGQPTDFDSLPGTAQGGESATTSPSSSADIPLPDLPLIQKPVQGTATIEQAQARANADKVAEVQPGGEPSVDDRLEALLFDAGIGAEHQGQTEDVPTAIYKLAKATGLPPAEVAKNYETISTAWGAAVRGRAPQLVQPGTGGLNIEQPYRRPGEIFRQQQPELAAALLRDPSASFILKDKKVSALHKAWNAAADFAFEAPIIGAHNRLPDDLVKEIRDQRVKRDEPQQELVLADDQAKQMSDGWVDVPVPTSAGFVTMPVPRRALVPLLRAQESWAGLNVSKGYDELANMETLGLDTRDKQLELLKLEQEATRRDYGEGAVEQIFSDAAEMSASSADVAVKGGVTGVAGGVVGGLITETPAGAAEGFALGTKLGASYGTWHLERGSSYRDMLNATKRDGTPAMDAPTARLASAIYATLATGVEFAAWGPMFKAMGPLGALIKSGEKEAFTAALVKNPVFMAQVKRLGGSLLEVGFSESGEEFLQDATQQAVEYFARAHAAGDYSNGGKSGIDFEQSKEAWAKAVPGALAGGLHGEAINLATQAVFRDKAVVSSNKLRELAGLGDSEAAQAAPQVIADMFAQHTAETGEQATHAFITAREVVRLFQENEADADSGMRHLIGAEGPQQLADAAARNGKLVVPIADYIEKWAPQDIAKRLVDHTALSESALTAAEAKALPLDSMAEDLAKRVVTHGDDAAAQSQFDTMERQLVESGRYTPHEASLTLAPARALIRTAAATFKMPAQKLFQRYTMQYGPGDEAQSVTTGAPADSRYLTRGWVAMSPTQQRRAFFIDSTTGALNERAWSRSKPGGRKTAVFSIEGVKYENDKHGHDAGNAVYRAGAQALSPHLEQLFKVKGDFASYVKDQAELDQVLAKANASAALQGFTLTGSLGPNLREAAKTNNDRKLELEAKKERAPRGTRPLASTAEFTGGGDLVKGTPISEELGQQLAAMKTTDAFNETYVDAPTGLLNKDGFDASGPRTFQLSGDADGIKEMNDLFGEDATDRIIDFLGNTIREAHGHQASMAHMSGDEFQGKHDNEQQLKAFATHVQQQLEQKRIEVEVSEASQQKYGLPAKITLQGLPFSFGVGKTVDDAERALQQNKAERQAAGLRGPGKIRGRVVAAAEGTGKPGTHGSQGDQHQRPADRAVRVGKEADLGRQRFFDAGRLEQEVTRLEAPADKGVPRGYTDVAAQGMERIFRIALNPNADYSTFLHETGHVFLELFGDLAEHPDAPARVKTDYAKALKWLGVETRKQVTREQHEKFARGFEAYLMEGKAPSPELARSFERFKLWMKKIYRDIKSLGVELNDDIRGVFDRLLATDDELQRQARKQGGGQPLAQDIIGLSDDEYAKYREAEEDRLSNAQRQVDMRVMKDRLREQESWWKSERKLELGKALEAYEALPARRAQQFLRGRTKDAATSVALDRKLVAQAVGKENVSKFITRSSSGEKPDTVASVFPYATGKAMLEDILALPEKQKWASQAADDAMHTKYPEVLDDRLKLANLVGMGLHGDYTEKLLLQEWVALKKKVSVPGTPVWTAQTAPVETLRLAAKKIVGRMPIGRLSPAGALQAERKAADEMAAAAGKGDFAQAFLAQQDRLINMFTWRELAAAADEREKFLELAGKLGKDVDARKSDLGKARPIYRDAVVALLEALQLREADPDSRGASVTDLISQMDADGQTVGFDENALNAILVKPRGYKDLTVDEMRLVRDTLASVKAAANGVNTAIYEGKRMDIEELEQLLLEDSATTGITQPPTPSSKTAATGWQRFRGWVQGFDGSLIRPEQLLRMYMGEKWVRAMSDVLQNAKTHELDLLKKTIQGVTEAYDKMPKGLANDSVDGKALFPTHQVAYDQNLLPPTKRHELLVMLLNMGNESNLQRLTGGRNITLEQLQKVVDMATKEELDWVQSVWNASESLWPIAAELEERDSGVPPKKLELRPLVTKHGTYRGGYFPAVYDFRVEQAGERQQAQTVAEMMDPRYVRPGTAQSHLKGRTDGFTGVIALEAHAIKRALGQVAHDIAYREAVKSVGQLLLRPAIAADLNNRMGVDRAGQILQWVKDAGMLRSLDGQIRTGALMKAVSAVRGGTTVAVLGYSATTAAGDIANLFTSPARSGIKLNHLGAALLEYSTAPQQSTAEALGKSPELRARREGLLRKLDHQVRDLAKSGFFALRSMRWIQDHAFAFLEATDAMTATPTWMGAYRQALMEGKSEAESVRFGDQVVRDNFPGVGAVDLAGILRDKTFVGQSLMFYRYFSTVYNAIRDMIHPLLTAEDLGELARRTPRAAGRLLAFLSVAVVFSELLSGRGPEDGEDWAQWYWRKLLFGSLSSVPGAAELGAGVEAKLLHKRVNPRGNAVTAFYTQVGDAITKLSSDDVEADAKAKALLQALGPALKLPIAQPMRTAGGIAAQQSDPGRNAAEVGSDVYFGRRAGQPKNPLSILGETIAGSPR